MIDYGARKTRTEVLRAEGRIRMIYRQAQKDIAKKLETFEKRHAARAEKYRQMVKDGKITQADYEAWMRGQVFQGEQWKAKKESIQQVLYNADNAALNVIDKGKLGVFTENANYVGYQLDHGARIDSGFNLYNEQAVARLIKDRPALLKKGVNKPKAFSWYNTLINNAVTQGIILGEGIPAIAKRIGEMTGEQTKNAMVRNARTAMVSAQNGGRLEGLMQQKALGIDVKKRWHATFDARTRDAHGELDGQIKELEEPFTNSLGKLMFPGDPTGAAGNVYNCRCRMDGYYPEYDFGDVRRDNETGEVVGNLSYNEWKALKGGNVARQATPQPSLPVYDIRGNTKKLGGSLLASDYDEAVTMIENSDAAKLYDRYGDACHGIRQLRSGGQYSPSRDDVEYALNKMPGMHRFSTMAHEMAHMFDSHIGRAPSLTFTEADFINTRCPIGSGQYKVLKICPSSSDEFLRAMRSDMATLKGILTDKSALDKMKTGNLRNATAGIQDAMDGFFGTQGKGLLPWGHGNSYYNRAYNRRIKDFGNEKNLKQAFTDLGFDASNQTKVKAKMREYEAASELWANCVSAVTCGGEELAAFEEYMPTTVAAARSIIGGL